MDESATRLLCNCCVTLIKVRLRVGDPIEQRNISVTPRSVLVLAPRPPLGGVEWGEIIPAAYKLIVRFLKKQNTIFLLAL